MTTCLVKEAPKTTLISILRHKKKLDSLTSRNNIHKYSNNANKKKKTREISMQVAEHLAYVQGKIFDITKV